MTLLDYVRLNIMGLSSGILSHRFPFRNSLSLSLWLFRFLSLSAFDHNAQSDAANLCQTSSLSLSLSLSFLLLPVPRLPSHFCFLRSLDLKRYFVFNAIYPWFTWGSMSNKTIYCNTIEYNTIPQNKVQCNYHV